LITYRGHKSGREYSLPVQYAQDKNRIFILPGQPEKKTWWRNFSDQMPVRLTLRGKSLEGQARLLDSQVDSQAIRDGLAAYLRRFPALAKTHQVHRELDGSLNADDLHQATSSVRMIAVFIEGSTL
jgi:hypothetical protein